MDDKAKTSDLTWQALPQRLFQRRRYCRADQRTRAKCVEVTACIS